FFNQWRTDLEVNKLRSGRETPQTESHLAKYRSLMPSLALIFHLIDLAGGATNEHVSIHAAGRAAAWCDYLEEHAKRIYQLAFDGDVEPAQRLAERISNSLPNPFTVRQVVQKGWSGLSSTDEVERAVSILEEHEWIQREEIPPGPTGGRSSVIYHINPLAFGEG
ncbi:DUF3987 domain-containing protein, partial [Singulisphaera rosea]